MEQLAWKEVLADLDALEVGRCVAAAERLRAESVLEDVPQLLSLLHDGRDFFVREAAAWPLVELVGPSVLRELFAAYQRGFDEGNDNDGFTAALLEMPVLHPIETKRALDLLVSSEIGAIRVNAQWLLEFCV